MAGSHGWILALSTINASLLGLNGFQREGGVDDGSSCCIHGGERGRFRVADLDVLDVLGNVFSVAMLFFGSA
jgi:hypothetical protein